MNFNSATEALPHILNKLLTQGSVVPSRNGETRELTMQQITLDQTTDPYLATPGRNASLPAQIAETMWILAGRNDVEWLSNYLPQAPKFSDDGTTWRGGYGPRLRRWSNGHYDHGTPDVSGFDTTDQLQNIIHILKDDPTTRRAVFAIFDPASDLGTGSKDIPCNNWVHFLPRDGVLHAHVAIRSNDAMWGWSGINQFEWSILTQVVAAYAGLKPGSVTFSISSLHLYERHYDKAQRIVDQTLLADNDLDAGMWNDEFLSASPWFTEYDAKADLDELLGEWFRIEKEIRENRGVRTTYIMDQMPTGLFLDWLLVLNDWWSQNFHATELRYNGTSMFHALVNSPKPAKVVGEDGPELIAHRSPAYFLPRATDLNYGAANHHSSPTPDFIDPGFKDDTFVDSVDRLHRDKGAVYGISWRKRGETYSILPNIARKIDRLGVGGAGDSEADTYIDLAVYLTKYLAFLDHGLETDELPAPCDDPDYIEEKFRDLDSREYIVADSIVDIQRDSLKASFEGLLTVTERHVQLALVRNMGMSAWALAKFTAEKEGWKY